MQDLVDTVNELGGIWLITADHGNAEEMVQRDKKGNPLKDEDGRPVPLTAHTLNQVMQLDGCCCYTKLRPGFAFSNLSLMLQVPVAIGGPGLPKEIVFRSDLKDPGLANVGATVINLLGFQEPDAKFNFEPTLITSK